MRSALRVGLAALGVLALAGCPRDLERSVVVDGLERTYLVHLPRAERKGGDGLPVVIAFHGLGGTGRGMRELTGLNAVADAEGFIAVYPDGKDRLWRVGEFSPDGVDDVAFIDALIDALAAEFPVDSRRMYVTGASNGALFSYNLACKLAGRIAAVAPVMGATMLAGLAEDCVPAAAVPVVAIHGTEDPLVPFEGGVIEFEKFPPIGILSAEDSAAYWAEKNGCAEGPRVTELPDTDPDDGTTVRVLDYDDCTSGAPVRLYVVIGGGHTWPDSPSQSDRLGPVSREFSASQAVWDFVSAYSRDL